jgi:ribosomal protein S27E
MFFLAGFGTFGEQGCDPAYVRSRLEKRAVTPWIVDDDVHRLFISWKCSYFVLMCRYMPADIAFPESCHHVKVGDLAEGMFLRVICEECGHLEEIPASRFRTTYPADTEFSDLAKRFKCTACGKVGTRFWDVWRVRN